MSQWNLVFILNRDRSIISRTRLIKKLITTVPRILKPYSLYGLSAPPQ